MLVGTTGSSALNWKAMGLPAELISPLGISESRLLAQDYYDFFSQLPNETIDGWRQIPYLRYARRGDLIAWALPPPNPDTGHIFVVAADPVPVAENTLAVMAYDASDIHHYDDSRGPRQTGVGSGTFHLWARPAPECSWQNPNSRRHRFPLPRR